MCGIATYSPKLDNIGNSYRGVKFFNLLVDKLKIHLFDQYFDNVVIGKISIRQVRNEVMQSKEADKIDLEMKLRERELQLVKSKKKIDEL